MDEYQEILRRIKELLKENTQGMSVTEIARALGRNKHSVGRYLDNLRISGYVEMRNFGMAKVFTLSHRIPLSAMLSYSKELIMVLDQENRVIQINDNFLNILGISRDDATGKNIEYLSPPSIKVQELLEDIVSKPGPGQSDKSPEIIEHADRYFRKSTIPTVFEDGGQGLTIILEEITEHVRAHKALRTSEERFRLMAENIRDGITIVENNKIVFSNHRLTEITGYSAGEIASLSPLDLVAEEDKENIRKIIERSESGLGIPSEIRFWLIRKNGERRYIYSRITSYQHGDVHLRYSIVSDITEWKEAEDALRNQYSFLQHLIDTYPRPIYHLNTDNRFLGCNAAFSRMVGKPRDTILGHTIHDLLPEKDAEIYSRYNSYLLSSPGNRSYAASLTYADGSQHRVTFHKSTFTNTTGDLAGIIGIVIDGTGLEITDAAV